MGIDWYDGGIKTGMPYKDPLKKKEQQARYRKEHKGQWNEYQKKYHKALKEADPDAYRMRCRERVRKSRAKHTLYKSKDNALPTPEDLKQ